MPNFHHLKTIVRDDLMDQGTLEEREWLESREIVVLWYQELCDHRRDLEQRIASNKQRIASLKPPPGHHPSAQYVAAKREFEQWRNTTAHTIQEINLRQLRARHLIKIMGLDMHRDLVIDTLEKIVTICRGTNERDLEEVLQTVDQVARERLLHFYKAALRERELINESRQKLVKP